MDTGLYNLEQPAEQPDEFDQMAKILAQELLE
jgi:hypothetical protein